MLSQLLDIRTKSQIGIVNEISVSSFILQPLYAKQVEVEDYKFLCVARVELQDQKFTLIGIMGNWWVLQLAPCLDTFSVLGNKAVNNFIRN